jgi:hypothetical protein
MVDSEVNAALARLYACEFSKDMPSRRTIFDALKEGDFEVVSPDGLNFGSGVIRTRWTEHLIRARDSLLANPHFVDMVKIWDHAERVYSHYASEIASRGGRYDFPNFGANAVTLRLGIDALLQEGPVDTVLLLGANSPNVIREGLAFLAPYDFREVIIGDNDPFLFELCEKDGLEGVTQCLCDFSNPDSLPEYDIAISSNTFTYIANQFRGWKRMAPLFLNVVDNAKRGVVAVEYMNFSRVLEDLIENLRECHVFFNYGFPKFTRGLSYDQLKAESYEGYELEPVRGSFCVVGKK